MNRWLQRTVEGNFESTLSSLLSYGALLDHDSAIVVDLQALEVRWKELADAFPSGTLHAVAVKANPLLEVLRLLVGLGAGLEVASGGELALALAADCPTARIVYDSPAKTARELSHALHLGVRINANSWAELERIEALLASQSSRSQIGLRLNPVIAGSERESATMVATAGSKFGLLAPQVEAALARFPFLSGLHVHVGSQVATREDLVLGVRRALELAQKFPQIRWLDIGGGLPSRYRSEDPGLSPKDYAETLLSDLPGLAQYDLITEVGRALHSGCGWAVTRTEYADQSKAILHLGADFALRTAYQPESWYHEMTVHGAEGRLKVGELHPVDLYGPLCFSGDRIAQGRLLPRLEEGDLVVVHDTGAYTLSMWSRYCSRAIPPVYGWTGTGWKILRQGEAPEDLVEFWSSRSDSNP